MPSRPRRRPREGGFTYLGLIILVAIIGLVGAASLKIGALLQRAAAEEALLDIGAAFGAALQSYAEATPAGQPRQPPTLQELLRDPRFPGTRRHLRKLFVDPMTGKAEWGVMYMGDKVGVIGVYSLSNAQPFKIANFGPRFANFERKERISDWRFTMTGQGAVPPAPPLVPKPAPVAPLVPAPSPARSEAPELSETPETPEAVAPPVEAQAELTELEPAEVEPPPEDK